MVTITLISFHTGAQVERSKVLGGYVYNFAKLTGAEKQDHLTNYNIVVVTGNNEVIQEFKMMEQQVKIGKKNIKILVSPNAQNIDMEKTCLIFIGNDKLANYPEIFESSKKHEVLLVSENYSEKRQILFNLYDTGEGKMLFEINKGNIYERGISISDEILLMGGTEIDVVELYLDTQEKLKTTEQNLSETQNKLKDVSQQVTDAKNEVIKQNTELLKQKSESQKLINEINIYKNQLKNQQQAFLETKKNLVLLNDSLLTSKKELDGFKKELARGENILKQQNNDIAEKERILAQKNITIKKQQNIGLIIVTGLLLLSFLSILLYKSFLDKKKKNKLLREQQSEITVKNRKLEENNKMIKDINAELKEKNEELTATLEEIKQIQNQLVQSEKMASLGVLSAGIAHEINNPINFVYAGINSLLRDFQDIEPVINEVSKINPDSADLNEKISKIQQLKDEYYFDDAFKAIPDIINDIKIGADRTAEIVKGLKSFSRTDKAELQTFDIHEALDTSLLLLKNKYKNHIEIIQDYDKSIPLIKCYPGKISQAFLNIISNAVDSIGEKGKVWIATKHETALIQISIKDNGCGMPTEVKRKIFDPFYTTKEVGKGTGLGLAITYGIISEHNGKIKVISAPGKGTEFRILLPII